MTWKIKWEGYTCIYLIGIPDRDKGEHMGKAIWRYNFWEFSRIKDRYESSKWKLQNNSTEKNNCKQPKRKDYLQENDNCTFSLIKQMSEENGVNFKILRNTTINQLSISRLK